MDVVSYDVLADQSVLPSQAALGIGHHFMRAEGDQITFGRIVAPSLNPNYLYGTCYSAQRPIGMLRQLHIGSLVPITEAQFDEARQDGWTLDRVSQRQWFLERALAIVAEAREHAPRTA